MDIISLKKKKIKELINEKKTGFSVSMAPSIGSSVTNWAKILFHNGVISLKYMPRVLIASIFTLLGIPFRVYEYLRLNRLIERTIIKKPPVFILGHWRSGTTLLHNILSKDPQFGFITMHQAIFPKAFMSSNFFKVFLKLFLPKKRLMDSMEMGVELPQEDELAMGNLIPYTFYNGWYFPGKMMESFFKYIRFKNISPEVIEIWKQVYLKLLKKATLNMRGKSLILKNPAHTARIKMLIEMFPDSKFIHIYRNPYNVYVSTLNLYERAIRYFMLQKISDEELENNLFRIYKNMMISYFKEMKLIPDANLVEIRFEDLEKGAMEQLEKIYIDLKLSGFKRAKPYFIAYLNTLKGYRKNKYFFKKDLINKIKNQWNFAIEKWNYKLPKNIHII